MGTVSIWVIVEFSGYKMIDGFSGKTLRHAMKKARDNWDEDVKITFVKEAEKEWTTRVELLSEMERDGRFVARRAAEIVRQEMAWSHRFRAA